MSSLFGSTKVKPSQITPYIPPSINAGGISATPGMFGSYTVNPTDSRNSAVGGISDSFGNLGDITGSERATVAPGFNDLLKARLDSISNSAHQAIGDLSQNLASRRILGSSFGQDTLSRAQAEFSKQRADVTAQNFLDSLNTSNQLLQQQYAAYNQQFQTKLNELNLETNLATDLSTKASSIMNQNATTQAQLNQQAAVQNANTANSQQTGFGKLLGTIAGIGLAPFTGGASLALTGAAAGGMFGGPGLSQSAMGGGAGGGVFG